MVGFGQRFVGLVNNLSWAMVFLFLLTIGLPKTNCRPVSTSSPSGSTTLDESSPHRDEPMFFDSQRNTESDSFKLRPQNNSGMIVRVIVTSSSSSSSSDSEDSEFSSFHDFQFPHQSFEEESQTIPTSSTVKPTTYHPHYSELTETQNSSPNSEETKSKEEVEDIFSVFYRAFSESSPGFNLRDSPSPLTSDSQNVERFQAFPPPSTRRTRVSKLGPRRNNNNNFRGVRNRIRNKPEDEEPASDNSNSNQAIVSSSVAVSHSKSVAIAVPRSRKVSNSTSSSISIGNKIQETRPTFRQHSSNSFDTGSNRPEAQPLVQELSPLSTTIKNIREISPSPSPTISWQQPEKVWSEPAKVWSLPAQVWSEPEKNWGQPERNWGQPEKVWGQPEQSWSSQTQQYEKVTTPKTTSSNHNANSRRSIYDAKPPKSHQKNFPNEGIKSNEEFKSQEDEDYQRDSAQPDEGETEGESTQGSFVILGDDENEQDSIDGEFDRHLVLPVSTSTTQKPSHNNISYNNNNNRNSKNNSPSASTFNSNSSNNSNSQLANNNNNNNNSNANIKKGKKFGYVLEGSNVRRYRVEERTPDGFIVGEYGVLNNQNAFLRGVRYTADGTINPRLIHEALMKFLSLRRR